MPKQSVYFFSKDKTDGNASMKNILGGKGANLAEMTSLGLPVPPGFTISTEVCQAFYDNGEALPAEVKADVLKSLSQVESLLGKKFGDHSNPLLVSVRSGARASMPGMMDTILNLGLNDHTVEGLAKASGNPRFAWDSYRRFLTMYSNVVMGMNTSLLEVVLEDLKDEKSYKTDQELQIDDLKKLVDQYKRQILQNTGKTFPLDPMDQLWGAITAVFQSWNSARAKTYRNLHGYPSHWGTAVNVQSMVFGNMGDSCATGVAFTRNPSTGEKLFYGEYLINAQGEDVVAGIRTPNPITKEAAKGTDLVSLEEAMPQAFKDLEEVYLKLEGHYRDMQDIEFTIEDNKLWMLQTRNGKRTAKAALRIACEMMDEKMITEEEALLRISPSSLDQLLHPTLDSNAEKTLLAKGLPASPGGASGFVVFSSEDAVKWAEEGKKVILARVETSPEDIEGMVRSVGILTTRGGMTSHAAVVARGMGKCCVAGCGDADISEAKKELRIKGYVIREGEMITLDGSTGEIFLGEVKTIEPKMDDYFKRIMKLADTKRTLKVRANSDTPHDSEVARSFGAEGIGLCRTEHMFFGVDRIDVVRKMIMADTKEERELALEQLLPMQREDFVGIFKAMKGLPVTIRLLDPPLHEFLPHTDQDVKDLALRMNVSEEKLSNKVKALKEFNPMLGHRGCRLAITYPEIYRMQAKAVALAACDCIEQGIEIEPEIMIPLVGMEGELKTLRALVEEEVQVVQQSRKKEFPYLIGTMIELPRAALTADEIAKHAQFFSFGTNDLTQTTLGLSRDDSGRFLATYVSEGLLEADPFATIDQKGVGKLVEMAVELGRKARPGMKMGVCGEHGGDPNSVEFFHGVGLDYVSCSPFRVPIARLASAQAAIKSKIS
ncbi:MAG: pyruvate, phosphate dikinase [Bdellovibrionales bacterium]|nr:pyruvate, phosphate dikinase [Bdellovibrionales bacterium]